MKIILKIFIVFSLVIIFSCGEIVFRDIDCRDFEFSEEKYWPPQNKGREVTFVDGEENEQIFTVTNKFITHITNYESDTGCGCEDFSDILLTNNSDSIWFQHVENYIENNEEEVFQRIGFVLKGVYSVFYSDDISYLENFIVNEIEFKNVKKYEYDLQTGEQIRAVYLAEGFGIISFEFVNGKTWFNKNLTVLKINEFDSFDYLEDSCY